MTASDESKRHTFLGEVDSAILKNESESNSQTESLEETAEELDSLLAQRRKHPSERTSTVVEKIPLNELMRNNKWHMTPRQLQFASYIEQVFLLTGDLPYF
jgi:hypothetical protein